jgi:hypothetical protein
MTRRLRAFLFCTALLTPATAFAQAHDHEAPPAADPHAGHDMSSMPGMEGMDHASMGHDMEAMDHDAMAMTGALGPYAMSREASGTSWQPDAASHGGVHVMRGPWMLMGHAMLNGVYDDQGGPRGDDKAFVAGMVMGSARRDFANGDILNLRAMLSPDPFMGKSGYPLLLAAGETADGRTPLVDRQHPHELVMELSASWTHRLSETDSAFVYAGLPGEPAFGPPAFMHRSAAMDSPEAPISHHWLDSTHITFGVLTGGWVHKNWKLEASRFRGREPDENRYDIESPKLDSSAVRVSWNPGPNWSLQASWADITSPEALEPELDERRWSASALYARPLGSDGLLSATAAWGRKDRSDGVISDAFALEAALKPNAAWTLFGRAERLETDELDAHGGHAHGDLETVGKVSVGAIRDWRVAQHVKLGLGGLASRAFVPSALEHAYDKRPTGAMAFVRILVD